MWHVRNYGHRTPCRKYYGCLHLQGWAVSASARCMFSATPQLLNDQVFLSGLGRHGCSMSETTAIGRLVETTIVACICKGGLSAHLLDVCSRQMSPNSYLFTKESTALRVGERGQGRGGKSAGIKALRLGNSVRKDGDKRRGGCARCSE
jgi:hypothetical protein